MTQLAVIADDLTGANDTAVQFAKRNISSCVRINFDQQKLAHEMADVVVIDTNSRDIKAIEAYQKVKQTCEKLQDSGIVHIYKKIDSTLRGNIGAEIEAAASVFLPTVVIIAPAFPGNQRVTIGGCHFLDGVPIALTEMAHAPKSPINESQIIDVLREQTDVLIGLISMETVKQGAAQISAAIRLCLKRGEKWIVFDASEDKHLDYIVEAAKTYNKLLWVGSAGLAEHLPAIYQWKVSKRVVGIKTSGPILIVAGSVSKTTQLQIQEVVTHTKINLIKLNVASLLENQYEEIQRCIKSANSLLGKGSDVLLASATQDADVKQALEAGLKYKLVGSEVSEYTARAMGDVAKNVVGSHLAGVILTGGDTAIHVCKALGAEGIEILEEVAMGIPLGRLVGGACSGLQVITKAGAFGGSDSFVKAMEAIRKVKEQEDIKESM
jgi:uncharacterized protein YgbK (DUF1537 family)